MEEIINDFNNTLLNCAQNLAIVCPNTLISDNIKDIEKIIKRKQNFTKFIDMFCMKVLKYKSQIDNMDEKFFMEKDYGSDVNDIGQSDPGDIVSKIFTLKDIWGKLSNDNRQIVMINMQILCALAQEYFNFILKKNN